MIIFDGKKAIKAESQSSQSLGLLLHTRIIELCVSKLFHVYLNHFDLSDITCVCPDICNIKKIIGHPT